MLHFMYNDVHYHGPVGWASVKGRRKPRKKKVSLHEAIEVSHKKEEKKH